MGSRVAQFGQLLKVVRERGGNGTGIDRPWCLPLAERVLVAVYYRAKTAAAVDRVTSPPAQWQ